MAGSRCRGRRSRHRWTRCSRPGPTSCSAAGFSSESALPHLTDVRRHQLARALDPPVGAVGRQPAALRPARRQRPVHPERRIQRAGWRTVGDVPSNEQDWPEGHVVLPLRPIYDARNVGYHGPKFSYASDARPVHPRGLQRLELAKTDRPPVMAEVDLVSSHTPWAPLPQHGRLEPGRRRLGLRRHARAGPVGRRGVARRRPGTRRLRAVHPVLAERARLLRADVCEQQLVLVVLGDHQPATIVSGEDASHDVPITIIARDPAVMRRISGWGWQRGSAARPAGPGLADEHLPRPLPHRLRLVAVDEGRVRLVGPAASLDRWVLLPGAAPPPRLGRLRLRGPPFRGTVPLRREGGSRGPRGAGGAAWRPAERSEGLDPEWRWREPPSCSPSLRWHRPRTRRHTIRPPWRSMPPAHRAVRRCGPAGEDRLRYRSRDSEQGLVHAEPRQGDRDVLPAHRHPERARLPVGDLRRVDVHRPRGPRHHPSHDRAGQAGAHYRVVNTAKSGDYRIEKTYITDPRDPRCWSTCAFMSLTGDPYQVYILQDPSLGDDGTDDTGAGARRCWPATAIGVGGGRRTRADEGLQRLPRRERRMDRSAIRPALDWTYVAPEPGNIVQTGRTQPHRLAGHQHLTMAVGFGTTRTRRAACLTPHCVKGFASVAKTYGAGWQRYLDSLEPDPGQCAAPGSVSGEVSAMVFAASEDKTFRGGFVAAPHDRGPGRSSCATCPSITRSGRATSTRSPPD